MLPSKKRLSKKDRLISPKFSNSIYFRLLAAQNNLPYSRFGVVVSKRIDKRAVVRNKLKRQIYSIIRERLNIDSHFGATQNNNRDYVFILKKEILSISFEILRKEIIKTINL